MSNVKQAHTVPKFYLEHFTGSDGHVWNYDKSSGQQWKALPENTATQGNFYAVRKDDGTLDLTLEKLLAEAEAKAQPVYEMILRGEIPAGGQARADFATFLGLQFVRTTTMRQFYAEHCGRQMQERVTSVASNKEAFDDFIAKRSLETGVILEEEEKEELRLAILTPSNFVLNVPQTMTIPGLLAANEAAEAIYKKTWTVGKAINGYFITSDNPVTVSSAKNVVLDNTKIRTIYDDKSSFWEFPMSPSLMLIMTWQDLPRTVDVPRSRIMTANRDRAIRSYRFIYSHKNDDGLRRLANKYKNAKWGVREIDAMKLEKSKVKVERI